MRPTVLLFDIDGTLVSTPGCGRRALERAFSDRYGRTGVLQGVHFGGMTDRALVRQGLAMIDEPTVGDAAEAVIDELLAAYVPLLEDEIARTAEFRLHAGVVELLDALGAHAEMAIGLGTGNIRPGARVKLARLGIHERFPFGGFGCDHEDRAEILRIGAARGAALLGIDPAGCRVVVVGDTPRDVAAAQAIGAESLGVGTCGFTPDVLHASGASWAVADLTEPAVLEALLGDGDRRKT
jgi:phosphoglycolate phosphatase-like HAD superfamily hydrolase